MGTASAKPSSVPTERLNPYLTLKLSFTFTKNPYLPSAIPHLRMGQPLSMDSQITHFPGCLDSIPVFPYHLPLWTRPWRKR